MSSEKRENFTKPKESNSSQNSGNIVDANNEPGVLHEIGTENDNEGADKKASKSPESPESDSPSDNESQERKTNRGTTQNITESTEEDPEENRDRIEGETITADESNIPTASVSNNNDENTLQQDEERGKVQENDSNDSLGDILKRLMAVVEAKNAMDADAGTSKSTLKTVKNFFGFNSFLRGRKQSKLKVNPVLFSLGGPQRPRQPFMQQQIQAQAQAHAQPTTPTRNTNIPPPPSYYSSQVRDNQHQPQLIREISNRRLRASPGFQEQTQQMQPQRGDIHRDAYEGRQLGQLILGPNNLMNLPFWAPYPDRLPPNVPACLAHLINADSLFIIQQINIIELIINVSEPNFYLIQNRDGQCIYYAYETSNICVQYCCRNCRGFQLHIMDVYENEIIYINKPCGCNDYFCCYPVMEVYSPPLVPVGAITQTFHPSHIEFAILDADENKIFKIHGPCVCMTMNCCVEADFTIHALDENETEVGIIKRHWGGFVRTYFTNADLYGITFPVDLDVRLKAVFLGALFLIDYTFYE